MNSLEVRKNCLFPLILLRLRLRLLFLRLLYLRVSLAFSIEMNSPLLAQRYVRFHRSERELLFRRLRSFHFHRNPGTRKSLFLSFHRV